MKYLNIILLIFPMFFCIVIPGRTDVKWDLIFDPAIYGQVGAGPYSIHTTKSLVNAEVPLVIIPRMGFTFDINRYFGVQYGKSWIFYYGYGSLEEKSQRWNYVPDKYHGTDNLVSPSVNFVSQGIVLYIPYKTVRPNTKRLTLDRVGFFTLHAGILKNGKVKIDIKYEAGCEPCGTQSFKTLANITDNAGKAAGHYYGLGLTIKLHKRIGAEFDISIIRYVTNEFVTNIGTIPGQSYLDLSLGFGIGIHAFEGN